MDFGQDSKIKYLSFAYTGTYHENQWAEHPERLEWILAALSRSGAKETLKTLNVIDCGVAVDSVSKVLEALEMGHVEVVEDGAGPME